MSRRELLKGSTETLLLALVAEGAMYGYQMMKEMERRSAGYFSLKEGTLYPALHRLEKESLIEGRWREASSGQVRRYYEITPKGREALLTLHKEWRRFSRAADLVVGPQLSRTGG